MSNRLLSGSGPVPFSTDGKMYFVPITDLSVTTDGVVDSSRWRTKNGMADDSPGQVALDALVKGLLARETLKASESVAPPPALVFRAAYAGTAGNKITVTVTKVEPNEAVPADSKLEFTVVESAEFPGLSTQKADATFVGTVLGATVPLIKLKAPLAADIEYPLANTYEATGPADLTVLQKADDKAASFVLVDANGATGPVTSVVVTATDEAAKLFSLAVTRTTKTSAKLAALVTAGSADAKAVEHAIVVEAPTGKSPALPKLGEYHLAGGSDTVTVPAVKSSVATFAAG